MRFARPVALLVLGLAVFAFARPASAHAAFVSSSPEPGERLESAPGFVRLRFSEPLIPRLSRATVDDPTGRTFPSTAVSDDEISVRLETNAPGEYEVRWTTVSPMDGHTLRGTFRFGVGVTPGGDAAPATGGPQASDLALAVARAIEYAGLLAAGGMLLMLFLSRRAPPIEWVRPRLLVPLLAALVGGVAVIAGEGVAATSSLWPGSLAEYFFSAGSAGWARLIRVGAEAVAITVVARGAVFAAPAVAVALGALATSGHAAALRPAWWGIFVDAAHLGTASLWAGGILALAMLRPRGGWRGGEGEKLLERFTPVALNAFALTLATGILRASQELGAPTDLVTSSYGRVLSAKILGVLAMVPLSISAWRRVTGSLRREAVLVVAVVTAAALLAAYPLPPGRAVEAEEEATAAAGSARALPRADDLTLGGDAGKTLVGLTFRPGEPGRNEVLVFILPLSGSETAQGVPVSIKAGSQRVEASECGLSCRRTVLMIRGGEELELSVGGPEGGTARFTVPAIPTRIGSQIITEATTRMRRLRSLRVHESLEPADPVVRNEYTFVAPDRLRISASNRFGSVAIGRTQYQRSGASKKWTVTRDSPPITGPVLIWSGFDPVAARIVGRDEVAGRRHTVVSFFTGSEENPIWFRLWVDDERLVRRVQMRAPGHFMDQDLGDFDAPLSVNAPR